MSELGALRASLQKRTAKSRATSLLGRRGRPPKYGGPSQVVAVTLPRKTVEALEHLHSDLGWAIVSLVDKERRTAPANPPDVQLVEVNDGQFLIVVNAALFRALPGIQIVPFSATQAFLALDPGRGITDLELAVRDRLERLRASSRERTAIALLGRELRKWRRDPQLSAQSRSIILVSKRRTGR